MPYQFGGEVGQLVPHGFGVRVLGPACAERLRHLDDDLAVDPGLAGERRGGSHAADAPLRVRERAVLLREARRGKHDVGVLACRVVQEDVLRHEEVEPLEPLLDVARVGLGLGGVLADEVERLDAPVVEAGDDLVEAVAGSLRHLGAPRLGELRPDLGVVDRLVAGEVRGVRAGVVEPLDVVLAAERVQAGRLVAEVPGHEHEVRERPDVVDAAGVLGDAERVEDRRVPLASRTRARSRGCPRPALP